MSSSSVCQGLQSCLEPRVIEPRVLRLKLAPPGSNFSTSTANASSPQDQVTNHELCGDKKDTISNVGGSGWSFLQSLTHTCHCNKTEDPQVYVHPTVKRSSSMLSEKSLEMCTESLGSETGSNAGESSDDMSLLSLESSTRHDTTNTNCVSKRVNRAASFPPPLTSITDFGVRPHREDGRLILEAVASPSPRPCFHADRSDGRLRLRLLETYDDDDDEGDVADEEWSHDDDVADEEEEEEEDEAQNEEGCGVEEELEECVENVEDEMGVTKFGRPSRCKESGNRVRDIFVELPSLSLCL